MNTNIYKTKVFLYNQAGEVIGEIEKNLDIQIGGINNIESAVTELKKNVLKELECKILEEEQKQYIKKKKKKVIG